MTNCVCVADISRTKPRTQTAVAQYQTMNAPLDSTNVLPGSVFQFSWYQVSSFETLPGAPKQRDQMSMQLAQLAQLENNSKMQTAAARICPHAV